MPIARIADVDLYYETEGTGPATVVFLNGIAMTVKSWRPIRDAFVSRGFRCLLHDCRGQLRSGKPAEPPYSMALHASDLEGLLDALGVARVHLVGTSYGAEIGMVFALRYPERVETLTAIAAVSEMNALLKAAAASWAVAAGCGPRAFFRCMTPWAYCNDYLEANEALLQEQEEAASRLPPEFFAAFERLVAAFLALDITADLARIRCPTLVIAAEADLIKGPWFGRLIQERIAQSELQVIPHAGHAVVLEQPQEIAARTLAFIERHRGSAEVRTRD